MQDFEKLGAFYLGRPCDSSGELEKEGIVLYDSKDLTTHAVCVGMTGSGKTGLCLALLEEAAIDGIPALCIDPKGDLGNLALTFPGLQGSDFAPWVDPGEATRRGIDTAQLGEQTAQQWQKGLSEWGQDGARVTRFKNAADVSIYTPGSDAGIPLGIMQSLAAPKPEELTDGNALRERIGTLVAGLLSLVGEDADPIKSRSHILLATIIEQAWRAGTNLDIVNLIAAVQKPAFSKIGALDLESVYPQKDRQQLALSLNNLLAAPGFSQWLNGEPVDIQRLLFTAEGKPRIAIISISHLNDQERMFVVTLVLNQMIAWMRTQTGTSSLRAIFYMDEIFGYFPPSANPPSKLPMLTLLKQARAFGLGCVLATQNPVDLDYKGLGNAGTWFIGRLQTERDKLRVLEGLESVLSGPGDVDRNTLDKLLSGITARTFLLRNVHEDKPVLFKSRWALSYLRGPLTTAEISKLMPRGNSAKASSASSAPSLAQSVAATTKPSVPAGIAEYFVPVVKSVQTTTYRPMIMGTYKLHFIDAGLSLDQWQESTYLAPLSDSGREVLWQEATENQSLKSVLQATPVAPSSFAELPASAMRGESYAAWSKKLASHLYETARATVLSCKVLNCHSKPNQSESEFRSELALKAREQRDAAVETLRKKYASKFTTLQERERRATERIEREKSQLSEQKLQTAFSVGASLLGALLGRKKLSTSNVTRAASAARAAGRIGRESGDVQRADENLAATKQQLGELEAALNEDIARIEKSMDITQVALERHMVAPRKADITVGEVALVWMPLD
jgi:hypothetical protein